jgi:protein SCO1/2
MGRRQVVKRWLWLTVILAGCAHRYRVEGLVLAVDPAQRTILVSHRPIEKYMPAMTMQFAVAPRESLSNVAPGARVDFELRDSQARNLRVLRTELQNVQVEAPKNQLAIGDPVPDFSLIDQNSREIHLSDFRGRVIALDFIYTRCPLPDVCPRLSANFAYIFKRLPNVQLFSITIDPQWDTPTVLKEYGGRWQSDGERWRFLTGTPDQIRNVSGMFGLIYWPEDGSISHTVATAIIGRDGKLAARIDGSSHRPEQLRDLIQHFSVF